MQRRVLSVRNTKDSSIVTIESSIVGPWLQLLHNMSGTSSVPGGVVVPPSPVSLHAQTKQVQQHLVNEIPVPVSYIANCRLCLGTHFGTRCTTIIDAPLINMMRQVFPVMVSMMLCSRYGLIDCDSAVILISDREPGRSSDECMHRMHKDGGGILHIQQTGVGKSE